LVILHNPASPSWSIMIPPCPSLSFLVLPGT
jgi:hypothetical protein